MKKSFIPVAAILAAVPVHAQTGETSADALIASTEVSALKNGVISLEGVSFSPLDVIYINVNEGNGITMKVNTTESPEGAWTVKSGVPFCIPVKEATSSSGVKLYVMRDGDNNVTLKGFSYTKGVYEKYNNQITGLLGDVKNALSDRTNRAKALFGIEGTLKSTYEGLSALKTELDGYKDKGYNSDALITKYFDNKIAALTVADNITKAQKDAKDWDDANTAAATEIQSAIDAANKVYKDNAALLITNVLDKGFESDYTAASALMREQKTLIDEVVTTFGTANDDKNGTTETTPAKVKDDLLNKLSEITDNIKEIYTDATTTVKGKQDKYSQLTSDNNALRSSLNALTDPAGYTGLTKDKEGIQADIDANGKAIDDNQFGDISSVNINKETIQAKIDALSKAIAVAGNANTAYNLAKKSIADLYGQIKPAIEGVEKFTAADGKTKILTGKVSDLDGLKEQTNPTDGTLYSALNGKLNNDKAASAADLNKGSQVVAYKDGDLATALADGKTAITTLNANASAAIAQYDTLKAAVAALNNQLDVADNAMKTSVVVGGATNVYDTSYKSKVEGLKTSIDNEDGKIETALDENSVASILKALKGVTIDPDPEVEEELTIAEQIINMLSKHGEEQANANKDRASELAGIVEKNYKDLTTDFVAPLSQDDVDSGKEGFPVGKKSYTELIDIYRSIETDIQALRQEINKAQGIVESGGKVDALNACDELIVKYQAEIEAYKKALKNAQDNYSQMKDVLELLNPQVATLKTSLEATLMVVEPNEETGEEGNEFYNNPEIRQTYIDNIKTTLANEITKLEEAIASSKTNETLYTDQSKHQGTINEIEGKINRIDSDALKAIEINNSIKAVEADLEKFIADHADNKGWPDELKNAIGYQGIIDGHKDNIASLKNNLLDYEESCTVTSNENSLKASISSISESIADDGTLIMFHDRYVMYTSLKGLVKKANTAANSALINDVDPIDFYVNKISGIKSSISEISKKLETFAKETSEETYEGYEATLTMYTGEESVEGSIAYVVAQSKENLKNYKSLLKGQSDLEKYQAGQITELRKEEGFNEEEIKVRKEIIAEIEDLDVAGNKNAIENGYKAGHYANSDNVTNQANATTALTNEISRLSASWGEKLNTIIIESNANRYKAISATYAIVDEYYAHYTGKMKDYVDKATVSEEWKNNVQTNYNTAMVEFFNQKQEVDRLMAEVNAKNDRIDSKNPTYLDKEGVYEAAMVDCRTAMGSAYSTFVSDVDGAATSAAAGLYAAATTAVNDAKGEAHGIGAEVLDNAFAGLLSEINTAKDTFDASATKGIAYNSLASALEEENINDKIVKAKEAAAETEFNAWHTAQTTVYESYFEQLTYKGTAESHTGYYFLYWAKRLESYKYACTTIKTQTLDEAQNVYNEGILASYAKMEEIKGYTSGMEAQLKEVITDANAEEVTQHNAYVYQEVLINYINDASKALTDLSTVFEGTELCNGRDDYNGTVTKSVIEAQLATYEGNLSSAIRNAEGLRDANELVAAFEAQKKVFEDLKAEISGYEATITAANSAYKKWVVGYEVASYRKTFLEPKFEEILYKINYEVGTSDYERYSQFMTEYNGYVEASKKEGVSVEELETLLNTILRKFCIRIDETVNAEKIDKLKTSYTTILSGLENEVTTWHETVTKSDYSQVTEFAVAIESIQKKISTQISKVESKAEEFSLIVDSASVNIEIEKLATDWNVLLGNINKVKTNWETYTSITTSIKTVLGDVEVGLTTIREYEGYIPGKGSVSQIYGELERLQSTIIAVMKDWETKANLTQITEGTTEANIDSWNSTCATILEQAKTANAEAMEDKFYGIFSNDCENLTKDLKDALAAITLNMSKDFYTGAWDETSEVYTSIATNISALKSSLETAKAESAIYERRDDFSKDIASVKAAIKAYSANAATAYDDWKAEQVVSGDVTGDGLVQTADYTTLRQWIVNDYKPATDSKEFKGADVNGDEEIDIADLVGVANILKGYTVDGKPILKTRSLKSSDALTVENVENGLFAIALDNSREYVGFQMDIQLPEGMRIVEASLADRAGNLDLMTGENSEGAYRLLASSISNEAMAGKTGSLVMLTVETDGSYAGGDINVEAIFADMLGNKFNLSAISAAADEATGIAANGIVTRTAYKVYNMGGQMVQKVKNGINILVGEDGSAKKVLKK